MMLFGDFGVFWGFDGFGVVGFGWGFGYFGSNLGCENGSNLGVFGLGVGAFSENGGFSGFLGYKLPSVFGGKIGDFGPNLVGRGILGVGVI